MRPLFLLAYTCSGLAGLVYQVSWTRALTLYVGHTTAAASAVVAAFLGGLAAGAAVGGVVASRLSRRRALVSYAALELFVAVAALLIPSLLAALTPMLRWAYADASPGLLFPGVRVLTSFLLVFVPAAALGATFPMAIRWFASHTDHRARSSSALYALNTTGAALGALLAGFVLIPAVGLAATTYVGVSGSVLAAAIVLLLARRPDLPPSSTGSTPRPTRRGARARAAAVVTPRWLVLTVLGVSGFTALLHEIAWTRVLTLVLGPTVYAFSATLAAVIGGVALGSGVGTWLVARSRHPAAWLACALAAAAATSSVTSSLAGGPVPRRVAEHIASNAVLDQWLWQGLLVAGALIVPTAICFGAAFPLALAIVDDPVRSAERRFGTVYAVNTIGAVGGALAAGFLLIPRVGVQSTLVIVSAVLIGASILVATYGAASRRARVAAAVISGLAIATSAASPPWDRELLASGVYMYAPFVPKSLDLETMLKAGALLYYREGASATVSVKRLTGTTTLAVDGKTDASNRGDMLTQKTVAHLPLLLHDTPRDVAIVGLGSGVTVGAALRHPIARADVIEISREVVAASRFFAVENRAALSDARTNLIVGDGRSHLLLSQRAYDVIVSEPSNPWIAGVAALFTQEFFRAARDRLAPGGVMCQWANAYNISERDLRSIVATFLSVFPDATAWLVGEDDVVLIGSRDGTVAGRLGNVERHWSRPGVADDLRAVAVAEPFSLLSLYVAGPRELAAYADAAPILRDDDMRLEFSAPRELHTRSAGENGAALAALLGEDEGPEPIRAAYAAASAAQWRYRGEMMSKRDAHAIAYEDYLRALRLDRTDERALDAFVSTAVLSRRASDALPWIRAIGGERAASAVYLVAESRLLAANGASADALRAARAATQVRPAHPRALEQLASLYADAGEVAQLSAVVEDLKRIAPSAAPTHYYDAVAALLRGDAAECVRLSERAIAADPGYAPVYDLVGAAYTRLGDATRAREAFLQSLQLDAHDSTAYVNLGVLELNAGNMPAARNYFAEALWLDSENMTARQGLARTR